MSNYSKPKDGKITYQAYDRLIESLHERLVTTSLLLDEERAHCKALNDKTDMLTKENNQLKHDYDLLIEKYRRANDRADRSLEPETSRAKAIISPRSPVLSDLYMNSPLRHIRSEVSE